MELLKLPDKLRNISYSYSIENLRWFDVSQKEWFLQYRAIIFIRNIDITPSVFCARL